MKGTTISHYKILDTLGGGGMGVVYQAEDLVLGRKVALKFLPERLAEDPEALARFQREARAASALNHPHICTIYELAEEQGRSFIVMELMDGQPLDSRISDRPMPTEEIVQIGVQVADALEAAHAAGIVHRDLKPANLFITSRGEAKVLDFGLAKITEDSKGQESAKPESDSDAETKLGAENLTTPGMAMGTIAYMSPEQVRGEVLDARTDLFSLGVVLYEMATGTQPFAGSTSGVIFNMILTANPTAPVRINPDLPDEIERILNKALEKDKTLRYQSASDLKTDLNRLRRDATSAAAAAAVATTSAQALEVAAPPSRRGLWVGIGAAAVTLALAALMWLGRGTVVPESQSSSPDRAVETLPSESNPVSIAVLPFINSSPDPDNEFFCDGLTEELIHALVAVDGLAVPARTSVFALKGKNIDVREAGEKLGVANVLEGSVRRSGERLRVTAELIKVADGFHLWSQTYDRQLEDVFAIQDEIARSIVESLQVKLLPGEEDAIQASRSTDAHAYDLYLQGRGYLRRRTREDLENARRRLEQAIAIDPDYAPAWALLAISEAQYFRSFFSTDETLERADRASRKAVELDPKLAESRVARGFAHAINHNYEEAEREFEAGIALDPRLSDAYEFYAIAMSMKGDLERAARFYEKAVELVPDDHTLHFALPQLYRSLGRGEEATRAQRRSLESTERYLKLDPENIDARLAAAQSLVALGERERGLESAEGILPAAAGDAYLLYNTACVFSTAGEVEQAIAILEDSYAAGMADPDWMNHDSDLDPLRDHPRFQALMERMVAGR